MQNEIAVCDVKALNSTVCNGETQRGTDNDKRIAWKRK
jgi:hypothetical protein